MIKTIKPLLWWIAPLLAIAITLLYGESDFLWKIEQQNLFLFSSLFFKQSMTASGGLLDYLSTFFTQFLYYPWLGVTLLCGWWWLLMWLIKRAFRISDQWTVLTLIPVAILLAANMCLGYWVYFMKMHGFFFLPTIGATAVAALLWAFRCLANRLWLRILFVVCVIAAGYPLMGAYALAAAIIMAVWSWLLNKKASHNAVLSAVVVVAVLAVPLVYYRYVYTQTNLIDIYLTGIPAFTITEIYPLYRIPYYLLALCFLAFTFLKPAATQHTTVANKASDTPKPAKAQKSAKAPKPILRWAFQGALIVALAAGVWHFWYKDINFHHELRMQRCIQQCDWQGVIDEGTLQDCEPTRAIVMMHNLALSRLGRQCDEMYRFRRGSMRSATELPVYMYTTAGRLIYYHYGVLNECHRMCMEQGVNFGWTAELLKDLTRCAMMGGELQVTQKYLSLLRQTLFYRSWADHMEQLMGDPSMAANDPETGPVTHMLHHYDMMSADDGWVEKYLMTMLSKTDSNDPYFQEQAVLGAMWTREPADFWPRLIHYTELRGDQPIPRIFMEAACLFSHMNQAYSVELPDPSIEKNYAAFMQQLQQYKGKPLPYIRKMLFPYFGQTYYFEYFFLRDITYF